MRSSEPTVFLVWEYRDGEDGQEQHLRAVDLDVTIARKQKRFLEGKYGHEAYFMIESCSANHLFASNQLGTKERIGKRKEL